MKLVAVLVAAMGLTMTFVSCEKQLPTSLQIGDLKTSTVLCGHIYYIPLNSSGAPQKQEALESGSVEVFSTVTDKDGNISTVTQKATVSDGAFSVKIPVSGNEVTEDYIIRCIFEVENYDPDIKGSYKEVTVVYKAEATGSINCGETIVKELIGTRVGVASEIDH